MPDGASVSQRRHSIKLILGIVNPLLRFSSSLENKILVSNYMYDVIVKTNKIYHFSTEQF